MPDKEVSVLNIEIGYWLIGFGDFDPVGDAVWAFWFSFDWIEAQRGDCSWSNRAAQRRRWLNFSEI